MDNCNCIKYVYWNKINLKPLMEIYDKIEFFPNDNLVIPNNLKELCTSQYKIIVCLNKINNISNILEKSNLDWESIDYDKKICFGGNIFKRKNKKGFWTLKKPCFYCYNELTKTTSDIHILNKACLMSYL